MSPIDAYPTPRETKRQFNVFDLIQRLVDPGTQEQSALAIVVICLGVGLTSAFYVFYACGLILGISLFAAGVTTTGLVAWSLIRCADHYQCNIMEEIAHKTYGDKMAKFTTLMVLLCQLGFVISFVVLIKTMLPFTI